MESTRQKKVARLVLKELSQIFNIESNNILGPIMISITAVRISPDLAYDPAIRRPPNAVHGV